MFRRFRLNHGKGKDVDTCLHQAIAGLSLNTTNCKPQSGVLKLDDDMLEAIYGHLLSSSDALSLSATCKQLYAYRFLAFRHLRFICAPGVYGLAPLTKILHSLRKLLDLLSSRSEYGVAVKSFAITNTQMPSTLSGRNGIFSWDMLVNGLDPVIAEILARLPHLRSFEWVMESYEYPYLARRTIGQLLSMRSIRHLCLCRINGDVDLSMVLEPCRIPVEHLTLYYTGATPHWSRAFLDNNPHLRYLNLVNIIEERDGHPDFARMLYESGWSWMNLEVLVIHGGMLLDTCNAIYNCLMMNRWPVLHSLSLEWTGNPMLMLAIFADLLCPSIRHLHLTYYGCPTLRDLTAALLNLPLLEELELVEYPIGEPDSPPPTTLEEIGMVLRAVPRLRIFTTVECSFPDPLADAADVATMKCVKNGKGIGTEDANKCGVDELRMEEEEDEDEDEDEEEDDDDDDDDVEGRTIEDSMDVDVEDAHADAQVAGLSSRAISDTLERTYPAEGGGSAGVPDWLQPYHYQLGMRAENFMDQYLRNPDFREMRILVRARRESPQEWRLVRFGQTVDSSGEEAARPVYMAKYLGILDGKEEDDAIFWMPRQYRRAESC